MELSQNRITIFENNKILNKIRKFILSDYYILSLAILITLLWILNKVEITVILLTLIACITLVIQKDQTPLIPLAVMCTASIAVASLKSTYPGWMLILFATPFFIGFIFNLIYYYDGTFKFGVLFYPYILVFISLCLGGIFYQGESNKLMNIIMAMYIGLIPLVLYLLLCNKINTQNKERLIEYVAKSIFYFGFICVLELGIYFIKAKLNNEYIYVVNIGWGISNTIGASLTFSIPFAMYLVYKEKSIIKTIFYATIGVAQFIMIFSTESRGASLFGSAVMIVSIIAILIKAKCEKKKLVLIIYIIFSILGIIALVFWGVAIKEKIQLIFHDGFDGNGRIELFKEALRCFSDYPTFGVGLCYIGEWENAYDINIMYFFHNTVLQVLASLGIVGVFAYTYFYIYKIKLLVSGRDMFSFLSLIAFIGFEGYAMMNTGTFLGLPFGIITTIILFTLQIINNEETKNIQIKKIKQKVRLCGEKI